MAGGGASAPPAASHAQAPCSRSSQLPSPLRPVGLSLIYETGFYKLMDDSRPGRAGPGARAGNTTRLAWPTCVNAQVSAGRGAHSGPQLRLQDGHRRSRHLEEVMLSRARGSPGAVPGRTDHALSSCIPRLSLVPRPGPRAGPQREATSASCRRTPRQNASSSRSCRGDGGWARAVGNADRYDYSVPGGVHPDTVPSEPRAGQVPQTRAPSRTAGGPRGGRAGPGRAAGRRVDCGRQPHFRAAEPERGRGSPACAGRGVTRPLICMLRADWPRRRGAQGLAPSPSRRSGGSSWSRCKQVAATGNRAGVGDGAHQGPPLPGQPPRRTGLPRAQAR